MYYFAYHRVSTKKQKTDRGIITIKEFCNQKGITLHPNNEVFTDKQTGKEYDRPGYQSMKSMLRPGDAVIVAALDRLGRTSRGIAEELQYFRKNEIRIMILNVQYTLVERPDNSNKIQSITYDMIIDMLLIALAAVAELEVETQAERQAAGIKAMKERGEWDMYGRPRSLDYEEFEKYYKNVWLGKQKPFECMKMLGLKRSTFYRYKDEYIKKHGKPPVIDIMGVSQDAIQPQPSSNTSLQLPDTEPTYEVFHKKYSRFIKGISSDNLMASEERAELMNMDITVFNRFKQEYDNTEFPNIYQQVQSGSMTDADCMAKLDLDSSTYIKYAQKIYVNEPIQRQTVLQPITHTMNTDEFSTGPVAVSFDFVQQKQSPEPEVSAQEPLGEGLVEESLNLISDNEEAVAYIDGLKAKIDQVIPIYSPYPSYSQTITDLEQRYEQLSKLCSKPLSEIQYETANLEKYLDSLLAVARQVVG